MDYIFLVVAILWAVQFALAYWQLRRFHGRIGALRRGSRVAVGVYGSRWRGRTYAVLALDEQDRIRNAEVFDGWTVLSQLRPVPALEGQSLGVIAEGAAPPEGMRPAQWAAFQHAAGFLRHQPATQTQPV